MKQTEITKIAEAYDMSQGSTTFEVNAVVGESGKVQIDCRLDTPSAYTGKLKPFISSKHNEGFSQLKDSFGDKMEKALDEDNNSLIIPDLVYGSYLRVRLECDGLTGNADINVLT